MHISSILQIVSLIDLTSLGDTDNEINIKALADKANAGIGGVHPASICVYSNFANLVNEHSQLPIAVVGGFFPHGQATLKSKIAEYQIISELPIQEVDIVINRGLLQANEINLVKEELEVARDIFKNKTLKVILETGQLTPSEIKSACLLCIEVGVDFIKTSTGKSATGATLEAVNIICQEIQKHYQNSGQKIGIKVSGGIRTYEDALTYFELVQRLLGEEWLNSDKFRIGASSLFDELSSKYLGK